MALLKCNPKLSTQLYVKSQSYSITTTRTLGRTGFTEIGSRKTKNYDVLMMTEYL
jgi:hypothetical protein